MKLKFECSNPEEEMAAELFLSWLSNSGEQHYWEAQQAGAEYDVEGDVTILQFKYQFDRHEVECVTGRLHPYEP